VNVGLPREETNHLFSKLSQLIVYDLYTRQFHIFIAIKVTYSVTSVLIISHMFWECI